MPCVGDWGVWFQMVGSDVVLCSSLQSGEWERV